eukprot:scaffold84868_cov44-Prasinocladus_malaysianus.AAC.1
MQRSEQIQLSEQRYNCPKRDATIRTTGQRAFPDSGATSTDTRIVSCQPTDMLALYLLMQHSNARIVYCTYGLTCTRTRTDASLRLQQPAGLFRTGIRTIAAGIGFINPVRKTQIWVSRAERAEMAKQVRADLPTQARGSSSW